MNLERIQEMWRKDAIIDEDTLDKEAIRSGIIHSKYLDLFTHYKMKAAKTKFDIINLRRDKAKYYRGEMSKQELEERGWEQWQYNKPLKSEMGEFLDSDANIAEMEMKMEYTMAVLSYLESVLKQIHGRDWQIKNSIEYKKFVAGM